MTPFCVPLMDSLERIEYEVAELNEQSRWNRLGITVLLLGVGFLICRDPIRTAYQGTCEGIKNKLHNLKASSKERRMKKLKAELRKLEQGDCSSGKN